MVAHKLRHLVSFFVLVSGSDLLLFFLCRKSFVHVTSVSNRAISVSPLPTRPWTGEKTPRHSIISSRLRALPRPHATREVDAALVASLPYWCARSRFLVNHMIRQRFSWPWPCLLQTRGYHVTSSEHEGFAPNPYQSRNIPSKCFALSSCPSYIVSSAR